MQLVEKVIADNILLEGELRAGELLQSADATYRLAGLAALVEIYDRAQRPHLAAERFAELTAALRGQALADDHPGSGFVTALLKKEGKRTEQRSQQKIDDATKAMQESAQKRGGD